eukprot:2406060-Alexandrium_andersonii.AAC.1
MSASLVGSEMCIRDRLRGLRAGHARRLGAARVGPRRVCWRGRGCRRNCPACMADPNRVIHDAEVFCRDFQLDDHARQYMMS